jgi:hypothetical protein
MADEQSTSPPLNPRSAIQPLDRTGLERVLARAAELQALTAEPSEGMSELQLEEVGKEVGISSEHIRQALAEERTRVTVPEERGTVGAWFGSTVATASRIVRGSQADVLAKLDGWMQGEECLRPRRRFIDRLTWEARRDWLGSIQTGFNLRGRAYALTPASEVGATVVPIDAERVLVRLDADLSVSRRRSVGWSGVTAGLSVLSAGALVSLASMAGGSMLVASVTGGVWAFSGGVASIAIARAQQRRLARAQLALEQVLDRLEHGEIKSKAATLLDLFVPSRR